MSVRVCKAADWLGTLHATGAGMSAEEEEAAELLVALAQKPGLAGRRTFVKWQKAQRNIPRSGKKE